MRSRFSCCRRIRLGRLVALILISTLVILSVVTVHNFSVNIRYSVDGFYQDDVDYFAKNILLKFKVLQNSVLDPDDDSGKYMFYAEISLTNNGSRPFPNFGWNIFFNQVIGVEPVYFPMQSDVELTDYNVKFHHWNGELYSFEPSTRFEEINPKETRTIRYFSSSCSVVFTDIFPNWYIVFRELEPRILESTAGEPNRFVAPYNSPNTWKRSANASNERFDLYNPMTPKERLDNYGIQDLGAAPIPIIPTPLHVSVYKPSSTLNVLNGQWIIVREPIFQTAVDFLQEKLKIRESNDIPTGRYIVFHKKNIQFPSHQKQLQLNESYELLVNPATQSITITASHAAGAFYAVQSLLSLTDHAGNIPETDITDGPRYNYRGLMIDVARNFHGKETIMRHIDAMAMYKLNKLHLHLTDDEGWRLEIPGLPELTEIGGKRCHDPTETMCLQSYLGSGPNPVAPGSGFYTVEDYKDILRYAVARHVEVLPEIDMPGHGHAAIKAMHARFLKLAETEPKEAVRYLLQDLHDQSEYASVQSFKDGAINPCITSTYVFITKIIDTLLEIHKEISPLKIFHYGGDEVPSNAWTESQMCTEFNAKKINKTLKQIFVETVADIAASYNLNIAAWEDGLMKEEEPFPKKNFPQKNIYVYAWNNLQSLQQAKRAYTFANNGYKVILTPATNLYLDHPYEPDPTERGLIWATRFISTKKVYQMMPENIYAIDEYDINGQLIPQCLATFQDKECPTLLIKQNIEGIQGSLFGELIRASWIMDYMVYPRMIALAERAWHEATWENITNKTNRDIQLEKDWVNFANTLGHKELARLDTLGILYRIPPPGAEIVRGNTIKASVEFPGLEVQISIDGGSVWTTVPPEGTRIRWKNQIQLRTKSADGNRYSRIVHLGKRTANK